MCFSAAASFGISAILLPAGGYCVWSALRKNKALLGLAVIPFAFSFQQFCEGLVWRGIEQDDHSHAGPARVAAFVFLYFALSFWPFWIPLCAFLVEQSTPKKRILALLVLLGLALGLLLYVPLLVDPDVVVVFTRNHSIIYDITQSAPVQAMPIIGWQLLYVLVVGLPMLIAPSRGFVVFGIALILAAAVSHFFYWHAFISVWCFFAAVLSLYLCYSFRKVPLPG
jgi:hypothetical protein